MELDVGVSKFVGQARKEKGINVDVVCQTCAMTLFGAANDGLGRSEGLRFLISFVS